MPQPEGFERCHKLLRENGTLALLWNNYISNNSILDSKLKELSDSYGGLFPISSKEEAESFMEVRKQGIKDSNLFCNVKLIKKYWAQEYSPEQYIGFIKTSNGYLRLNAAERLNVEKDVKKLIINHGGSVVRPYITSLYLAKRI